VHNVCTITDSFMLLYIWPYVQIGIYNQVILNDKLYHVLLSVYKIGTANDCLKNSMDMSSK